MGEVRYTLRARGDLLDLWAYWASKDPTAADRIYDRIEDRCRALRDHPRLGVARPEIGEGARMLVVERWLVLYRVMDDGVQVVRIVDGVRDLGRIGWAADR